jgi:hypothetical protein
MPSQLQNLANIQCENCHGPGSQHLYSQGIVGNTNSIAISYGAGDCSQCHDSLPEEYQSAEWNNSLHASSARETSPLRSRHTALASLVGHTAGGMSRAEFVSQPMLGECVFHQYFNHVPTRFTKRSPARPAMTRMMLPIRTSCAWRIMSRSPMAPWSRTPAPAVSAWNAITAATVPSPTCLAKYPLNQTNWAADPPLERMTVPQADMLEGVNAVTYGKVIPSAPHASVVSDTCVGCHMQPIATNDPAFTLAGGHTTKMSYTNSLGAKVP